MKTHQNLVLQSEIDLCNCYNIGCGCIPINFKQPRVSLAQDVNARYPYRVPDWLWIQQYLTSVLSVEQRREIEYDIEILEALVNLEDGTEYNRKTDEVALKISNIFALRDFTANTVPFENLAIGANLSIHLDPNFSSEAKDTINRATELLLRFAFDEHVIQRALDSSINTPEPMPEKYEMENGKPKIDQFGNKVYTPGYSFYLRQLHRPQNAIAFKNNLKMALSTLEGNPSLLVISQYSGNDWWGGAYYDYFHSSVQQLSRLSPVKGYLYIRLNSDKLSDGTPNHNNPAFWASKIAHEILHNLGYWHPPYANPDDRDSNNQGNTKAFIVAYEDEIYRQASNTTNTSLM